MQYNPQIALEFSVINDDGSESDMTVDLFGGLTGSHDDLNYHIENKPITVECSISKSLGGEQQTADIVLHNTPYIETFRSNVLGELNKIRGQKWRVRIYAWHDDNGTVAQTRRPDNPPVFVGDIVEDFNISSSNVTDTTLQLQALGHGWLATSGKMKRSWKAGTTYFEIVNDLFDYMINDKHYGRESRTSTPKKVILNDGELNKTLKRGFSMNRNPCETMNDLCRDFDYVWGINNTIPYMISRKKRFSVRQEPTDLITKEYNYFTEGNGLTSLVNYSKYTFAFSALWFNNFTVGSSILVNEQDQINNPEPILGRINELNINLSNRGDGHQANIKCSYYDESGTGTVILPSKRADNSGLRYE